MRRYIFKLNHLFIYFLYFFCSKAEMSWLRLSAGCSMLKICEQKGVGDQYSPEQFYNLAQLMIVS